MSTPSRCLQRRDQWQNCWCEHTPALKIVNVQYVRTCMIWIKPVFCIDDLLNCTKHIDFKISNSCCFELFFCYSIWVKFMMNTADKWCSQLFQLYHPSTCSAFSFHCPTRLLLVTPLFILLSFSWCDFLVICFYLFLDFKPHFNSSVTQLLHVTARPNLPSLSCFVSVCVTASWLADAKWRMARQVLPLVIILL